MSEDQDWRLKMECDRKVAGPLDRLLEHVRGPDVAVEAGEAVGHDVVLTHDGSVLFAYAADRARAERARQALEAVLGREGIGFRATLARWDDGLDEWVQVDPQPTGAGTTVERAIDESTERRESRTLVISSGKLVRAEVEQTMRDWAAKLGLDCEVIEHPHLLTTQVAFTVTGTKRKIDEFADALRAEELATLRTEREVMMSPL